MPTETSLQIDFDSPVIREFARSRDTEFIDPDHESKRNFLIDEGYSETNLTRYGAPFNPEDHVTPDPITNTNGVLGIIQAEIKKYDLVENVTSAILSQVETQTIHSQSVQIKIAHELFLASGLSPEEKARVETAFTNYVDQPDTNPEDFAAANNIPAAHYEALAYFVILKVGEETVDDRQDRAIREHYQSREEYRLIYRESKFEEVSERDDGAVEVDDPENPLDYIVEKLASEVENNPAMWCKNIQYTERKIGTLFQYPEFKIRWRRVVFKIGCIRISLKVPQLLYRITKRILYAGLAYSADVGQIVIDVLKFCLLESAIAATITGLVTANVAIAAAAFKALFLECTKTQLKGYIKCLLPELVLLKKRDEWRPI